jgi:hypothetical protein
MSTELEIVLRAVLMGIGATALLDLWNALLARGFGIPSLSMEMLGRWVGYLLRGRFVHDNIAEASPIPGERFIGWSAHYAIGVMWAALLPAIWGLDWARRPTLGPAMIVGFGTLVGPFFIMQPGMGLGIAASKTRKPNSARLKSVMSHAVYGLGLYAFALLGALLIQAKR